MNRLLSVGVGVLVCIAAMVAGGCQRAEAPAAADPGSGSENGTRIVSLSPAATVMLRDMGIGSLLVGRHGWDAVADASLPVVGDQTGIDYERLLAARPTHVVIEWGSRGVPDRLTGLAADRGFRLVPFETLRLEDLARSAEFLREVFAADLRPAAADRVVESVRGLSELQETQRARENAGRVLLVAAVTPTIDCLGPGSAHHEILVAAGFAPAIEEGGPWMSLSLEDVIALDPDAIVLVLPGAKASDGLGGLADAPLTAVRAGRAAVIGDPLSLIPSSNLVSFRERLIGVLAALPPLPSPRE